MRERPEENTGVDTVLRIFALTHADTKQQATA